MQDEIKAIAEKYANLIMEDNKSKSANVPTQYARVLAAITEATTVLRAAATVPQDHVRVGDRDMKVLGTPLVTADDVLLGHPMPEALWSIDGERMTRDQWWDRHGREGNEAGYGRDGWNIEMLYSTPEAATAAAAAKEGA